METIQELIPFAREVLSQKPSRALVKVYVLGSVCAVLGTVIGLVETVCHPFSSGQPMDTEMMLLMMKEQRTVESRTERLVEEEEEEEEEVEVVKEEEEEEVKEEAKKELPLSQSTTFHKTPRANQRSLANRLHAS